MLSAVRPPSPRVTVSWLPQEPRRVDVYDASGRRWSFTEHDDTLSPVSPVSPAATLTIAVRSGDVETNVRADVDSPPRWRVRRAERDES